VKRIVSLVAVLALTLLVVPAMAGDVSSINGGPASFYALNKISTTASTTLAPLPDDQLASIVGQAVNNVCVICANVGVNAPIISPNTNNNNNQSNNPR
jgi:hypothetical protein